MDGTGDMGRVIEWLGNFTKLRTTSSIIRLKALHYMLFLSNTQRNLLRRIVLKSVSTEKMTGSSLSQYHISLKRVHETSVASSKIAIIINLRIFVYFLWAKRQVLVKEIGFQTNASGYTGEVDFITSFC